MKRKILVNSIGDFGDFCNQTKFLAFLFLLNFSIPQVLNSELYIKQLYIIYRKHVIWEVIKSFVNQSRDVCV